MLLLFNEPSRTYLRPSTHSPIPPCDEFVRGETPSRLFHQEVPQLRQWIGCLRGEGVRRTGCHRHRPNPQGRPGPSSRIHRTLPVRCCSSCFSVTFVVDLVLPRFSTWTEISFDIIGLFCAVGAGAAQVSFAFLLHVLQCSRFSPNSR
jgi:hypothetical protein